jgi:hypothetical protein
MRRVVRLLPFAAFLRLLAFPQDMWKKRHHTNFMHTRGMLRGQRVPVATGDANCLVATNGGWRGGKRGGAVRKMTAMKLSRGPLLMEVMDRLAPLFDFDATQHGGGGSGPEHEGSAALLREVAVLVVAHVEQAAEEAEKVAGQRAKAEAKRAKADALEAQARAAKVQ